MKTNGKDNLIVRMTKYWVSMDKLYDKIVPMYRRVPRSEHKYDGLRNAIKKTKKEISIVRTRASHATRLYKRERKKNRDLETVSDYDLYVVED